MVEDEHEKVLVELKCIGELRGHLPNAVDELLENGTPVGVRVPIISVPHSLHVTNKIKN